MPVLNISTKREPKRLCDIPVGHIAQAVRYPDFIRLVCANNQTVTIGDSDGPDFGIVSTNSSSFLYYDLGKLEISLQD